MSEDTYVGIHHGQAARHPGKGTTIHNPIPRGKQTGAALTALTEKEGALFAHFNQQDAVLKEDLSSLSSPKLHSLQLAVAQVLAWNANRFDLPRSHKGKKGYSFVRVTRLLPVPAVYQPTLASAAAQSVAFWTPADSRSKDLDQEELAASQAAKPPVAAASMSLGEETASTRATKGEAKAGPIAPEIVVDQVFCNVGAYDATNNGADGRNIGRAAPADPFVTPQRELIRVEAVSPSPSASATRAAVAGPDNTTTCQPSHPSLGIPNGQQSTANGFWSSVLEADQRLVLGEPTHKPKGLGGAKPFPVSTRLHLQPASSAQLARAQQTSDALTREVLQLEQQLKMTRGI